MLRVNLDFYGFDSQDQHKLVRPYCFFEELVLDQYQTLYRFK